LGNEAYIVGIVPVVRPTYKIVFKKRIGKEQEERGLLVWVHGFETEDGVLSKQNILNHQTEHGDSSHTEEARCGTDRVGVADDRQSEKSQ
jgi:hypothetical protein